MIIVQLIVLGLAVGILSSYFGVGGGSLMVPVLYFLYPQLPPDLVIANSLAVIFIISLVNIYRFRKQGMYTLNFSFRVFAVTCLLGALIGTQLLTLLSTVHIKKFMGVVLLLSILKLLTPTKDESDQAVTRPKLMTGIAGFSASMLSSLTGLGGGLLFIPAFIHLLKMPAKFISPYSNIGMALATFMGTLPAVLVSKQIYFDDQMMDALFIGKLNLFLIICISMGSLLTSSVGVKLNSSLDSKYKKILLSSLLLYFSFRLLV